MHALLLDRRYSLRLLGRTPGFTVAALAACAIPARRAASTDPATTLRIE